MCPNEIRIHGCNLPIDYQPRAVLGKPGASIHVPGHSFQRRQFDGFPRFPRGAPMNQFRLVQAVDRFGQRVIVAVATAADGRLDTRVSQMFTVPNADVLRSPVGWISIPRIFHSQVGQFCGPGSQYLIADGAFMGRIVGRKPSGIEGVLPGGPVRAAVVVCCLLHSRETPARPID